MSGRPAIVELNDSELRVGMNGRVHVVSPGVAIVDDGVLVLGEEARKQARLRPRHANNRFWSRLSLDPLENATGLARHHADLAYAHLRQVLDEAGAPREVIFAVPGFFTREQLALLLGLTKAGGFVPVGIVDSAVAALAKTASLGIHAYVDVGFHQAVIVQLDVADEVVRTHVESVPGAGISAMLDAWAATATDAFIQQHRFDPLQRAATEQSLYDCFAKSFREPAGNKLTLEVEGHRVELSSGRLAQAAHALYGRIVERVDRMVGTRGAGAIYLSDRASALPVFAEHFRNPGLLTPDAIIAGCESHEQLIRSDSESLEFVTRLPAAVPQASAAEAALPAARGTQAATHIMWAARAYPVGGAGLFAHREGQGVSLDSHQHQGAFAAFSQGLHGMEVEALDGRPLSCNGKPVTGRRMLEVGDLLTVDESEIKLLAIRVVDEI